MLLPFESFLQWLGSHSSYVAHQQLVRYVLLWLFWYFLGRRFYFTLTYNSQCFQKSSYYLDSLSFRILEQCRISSVSY